MHRTNDFRTDLLDAKLPESLVPHLVCSLGDPAQEPRVADDALSTANHFEIRETLANPYGLLGRAVLAQMSLSQG